MQAVLLAQPSQQAFKLHQTLCARSKMEVQVDDRQAATFDVQFDVEKPFLAETPLTEHHGFRGANRVARQNRVAIAEIEQARTTVVDPENGMRKPRVNSQIIEMIEVSGPARTLVDFLQRHDIGRESVEQRRDFPQVDPQLSLRSESLDWRQSATVRDVERDESQSRHGATANKKTYASTGK
jgi:hypothetical protein